jgi:4-hydroxymandelate oxidase
MRLWPRPLAPVAGGHTRLQLFDQTLSHPLLLAPVAYQRLFHADGELATALAASAQDTPMVVSSLASRPLEEIAHAARSDAGARPWFQLYWQGERARSLRLLRRAEAAGYGVILFTVDAPIKLASLRLPREMAAVNLEQAAAIPSLGATASTVFDGWMAQAPTWDDLQWLRAQTRLPLVVKGILHPGDAERVVDAGCDGMVVSSHGGRVLAATVPALEALPAVVARVAGRVPVLFDSGVRSGHDIFVALALGARAVLIGRPHVWGLAAAGAMGVAQVLRLLRDELEMTMALTGCATLADIGPHCILTR